jgi:hypothetical protein
MVKGTPNYAGVVNRVIRQDIYSEVAKEMGVTPKTRDMQPVRLFDGTFDPNQAETYATSFSVHNLS